MLKRYTSDFFPEDSTPTEDYPGVAVYMADDVDAKFNEYDDDNLALSQSVVKLGARIAELEREGLEQSRLLGMSAEREAGHLARIAEMEKRGGVDFLLLWMTTPNPMLGNTVPLDMLKHGRGQKLAQFIEQAMEDEAEAQKARSLMETERK